MHGKSGKKNTSSPASPANARIDAFEGHADVSRPPTAPRIHRLSQLVDPADIMAMEQVRSPSGNLLSAQQWLASPRRPLSLRERREQILRNVQRASNGTLEQGVEMVEHAGGGERDAKEKKKV